MTLPNVENYRALLEEKAETLSRRLGRLTRAIRKVDGPASADFSEQAAENEHNEVIDHLDESARRELEQVEHALARLAAGSYGVCVACGGEIAAARLAALPETPLCATCAETSAI